MSDNFNIGNANIGNAMFGGTGGTISGSGVVNVHQDPLGGLRVSTEELVKIVGENPVPPDVRDAAELALAEARKSRPEPGRLRELMNIVLAGAAKVAEVTQAALNVMAIIAILEKAFS